MSKYKADIPPEFLPSKSRTLHPSLFGFTSDISVLQYLRSIKIHVVLLFTFHHDALSGNKMLLDIISIYNTIKGVWIQMISFALIIVSAEERKGVPFRGILSPYSDVKRLVPFPYYVFISLRFSSARSSSCAINDLCTLTTGQLIL